MQCLLILHPHNILLVVFVFQFCKRRLFLVFLQSFLVSGNFLCRCCDNQQQNATSKLCETELSIIQFMFRMPNFGGPHIAVQGNNKYMFCCNSCIIWCYFFTCYFAGVNSRCLVWTGKASYLCILCSKFLHSLTLINRQLLFYSYDCIQHSCKVLFDVVEGWNLIIVNNRSKKHGTKLLFVSLSDIDQFCFFFWRTRQKICNKMIIKVSTTPKWLDCKLN